LPSDIPRWDGHLALYAVQLRAAWRQPCPECGSLGRRYMIEVSETIEARESVGLKARHEGQRRPFRDGKYGDSLHRLTGKWNRRDMTIDREHDRYTERVVDEETGETIHEG
jgi:hypothetical protein